VSDDAQGEAFEQALNAQTLRGYDRQPQRVRIDSTPAQGSGMVTPEGVWQLGQSKDHRPDLPQVKITLSGLDPRGLPLTTPVVAGARADDPVSLPESQRVQASLGRRGVTDVGDCKMAALQTRATVAASGAYYRCPRSSPQLPAVELAAGLAPGWQGAQPRRAIYRPADQTRPQRHRIAEGDEYTVELRAQGGDQSVPWTERRLVVRALQGAATQERAVRQRLATAQREIATLPVRRPGQKRVPQAADLQAAAAQLVATHRVGGLVSVSGATQTTERPLRGSGTSGPACGASRPARSPPRAMPRPWRPRGAAWAGGATPPPSPPGNCRCPRPCWPSGRSSGSSTGSAACRASPGP
jgi:transposase